MFHEKERKIKSILNEPFNHKCIDCNKKNPDYISLNNAVFICQLCFKKHQKFPINISKPIKNNLSSLTLKELQYLYFGGNKKMLEFMRYEYPKLKKLSPSFIYKTIALEYYRNWLKYLIEGGIKPIKPNEDYAYTSIEDKDIIKNENIEKNKDNKDNNVITIDFRHDCYKYNDKYNRTITGFINNKEINDKYDVKNDDNKEINIKVNEDYIREEKNKNNFQEILSKNLRNTNSIRNYFKIINKNNYNKYINAGNINFFSFTQSGFFPPNKIKVDQQPKNNYQQNFNSNIILDVKGEIKSERISNNKKEKIENNIQTSRSSNKIYIKPKHYIYKSSVNKNGNKAKQNNLGIIKVNIAKDPKKQKQYLTNNENDKLGEIKRIIFNNKSSQISNNTNNNNEININSIKNTKNILSINEKSNLNNKLIFKKKNYKNFLYIKNEPKQQENQRSSINLDFDIISKRKMNTEIKTDYNDDSMTENSLKTYTMNKSMKSMKHFHQRNPRKLNRSTTNKRKNQKNNINKIHNLKRLKKEKIEILRSLKVLMKKKIELDEKDKEENMNT